MARILDPQAGSSKRPPIAEQDFMAVVLVGYGEHLHPFNEGPNVLSKALLPIGNNPIINTVLDWVISSGILHILLIVPPHNYAAISDHLEAHYASAEYPRLNIDVKRFTDGERDEDEGSEIGRGAKEGTARLLKRFRSQIKTDFVLLPCDLFPPSYLKLSTLLDRHRSTNSAALTAVLYDPSEGIRESEESILSAYDKASGELLLLQNMDNLDEDLELRIALLKAHPTLSLSTRLLDAHIYICRRTVLDLLATRRPKDLDSMKVQVVPWLVKGSWQKGLARNWSRVLCPANDDPLRSALARSTTAGPSASGPSAVDEDDESNDADDDSGPSHTLKHMPWDCRVLITRPPVADAIAPTKGKEKKPAMAKEPEHLIRANTLAGYWELNRRFLRNLNPSRQPDNNGLIHPSAQLSFDSVLGEGTKVGEKCSVKKTIIGRHCVIGKNVKLSGCVLWDYVTVDEGVRMENAILCNNVRVGAHGQIKDCEFGPGYEAPSSANLKGERFVVGQEAS